MIMRTLYEIITDAKDGKIPTQEECYFAMLVYEFMFNSDHHNLQDTLLAEKPAAEFIRKMKADNSFNMVKGALNKAPDEYLGKNWNPLNPECQKRRQMANKLFDKIVGDSNANIQS